MSDTDPKKPILIILHQETSTPGRVGLKLRKLGYALDIRRPRFDDPLPDSVEDFAGTVIFGGPMSANDPDDFVKREIDWINVPLREQKPFLGLCLGGQMLTKTIGGDVYGHLEGQVEVGYYPIEVTEEGEALLSPWPDFVYQWHREGMRAPDGTTILAQGGVYPHQAIQVGPAAFGFQFHPEVTRHMVHRWTTKAEERLTLPGAKSRSEHLIDRYQYDPAVDHWLDGFLDVWLKS